MKSQGNGLLNPNPVIYDLPSKNKDAKRELSNTGGLEASDIYG